MIWIDDIQFAKSIADLKMSNTVTAAKLHPNFEVFLTHKLRVVSRRLQEKSVYWRRCCTKRKTPSHGKAHRTDDL